MSHMNKSDMNRILKSLDIRLKSRLGQHFLVDRRIIDRQLEYADITKEDIVLEVGSGLGVLTNHLAAKARSVIAIEYDKRLYSYLKTQVADNVDLIYGDALKIEFPKFNKIVSNIPYQISSPLIFKLTEYTFDSSILMLQAEFANRLVAKQNTKNYSRLTVMGSYYYDIEVLQKVPKTSFFPEPKVDSAIIRMVPKKDKILAENEPLFIEFVRVVFNERRKMIKNSLASHYLSLERYYYERSHKNKLTKNEFLEMISELPNTTCRPEQLSLEELIQITNELHRAFNEYNKK